MKILQVIAPGRVGGAEQVVLDLSRALAGAGAEIHVAAIHEAGSGGAAHPFVARIAAPVRAHPIALPPRAYGRERAAVGALIEELSPAAVHTHGYRADVVDGAVARAAGVPVVSTVHGFTGGGMKNRIYEFLQRRAHRRFDAVVAVSRPLARELAGRGLPPSKIHTIPNARAAPEDLRSREEARRELGIDDDAFHVGWVGRVSMEKGPDLHLEALSRLGDVPFRATLIGDGRERKALERRTLELGLGERVRWAGVVSEAGALLPAFDVLVVSSRSEGTPMVVLEAMAAEVPIVASRVGGIPDLVGDEGALLVPPESSGALAEAIGQVLGRPREAAARAAHARRRFDEVSSPDRWARAHLELYATLGEDRPHPSLDSVTGSGARPG